MIKRCLVILLLLLLAGCASKGKDVKTVQGDPQLLYQEGLVQYNKRLYEEALKKFEEIKSSFPDSPPYSVLAELKVADCHFQKESYPEAIAAYEEFRKVHPTNEEIPYVLYQIGMSYYNQMRTADRDQNATRKALTSFEYLIASSSENFFAERAKEKAAVCRKRLADHEFYVGEFYFRQKRYEAAARRFEGLLEQFPKGEDEDKTLFFLGKSYVELGRREEAKEVLTRLVTDYPKGLYSREANTILDRGVAVKAGPGAKGAVPAPSGKPDEEISFERKQLAIARFEEEGRKQVSQNVTTPPGSPPKKESAGMGFAESKPTSFLMGEGSVDKQKPPVLEPAPQETGRGQEPKSEEKKSDKMDVAMITSGQERQAPDLKVKPEGEVRKAVAPVLPSSTSAEKEKQEESPGPEKSVTNIAMVPSGEARQAIRPRSEPELEVKPDGEVRKAVTPVIPPSAPVEGEIREKSEEPEKSAKAEKPLKVAPLEERFKVGDTDQPIDITSDRVETDTKDSLITFRGNVTARQRDMVIYADFLEATISQDGKAIERVTAGGNVKIQQGLRVANCEKAVFYNLEKKVVLTGEPRVWEGENMVSGEEIVVDMNRDRVEVKGGSAGRGKAKISP